jgi:hypothetical protein
VIPEPPQQPRSEHRKASEASPAGEPSATGAVGLGPHGKGKFEVRPPNRGRKGIRPLARAKSERREPGEEPGEH